VFYKDRNAVACDLRVICTTATETELGQVLVDFAEPWDRQYPTYPKSGVKLYSKSWMNLWNWVIPFFVFLSDIR
jgi:transposase-like protein